ncbi:hypothetical protein ACOMHN_025627 [Nucella lapillus]
MVPPFLQPHTDLQSAVGNAPLSSKHPTQLPTTDCVLSIIPLMGGQPSDAHALSPPSPLQQGGQSSNAPALSPPSPLPQGGQPIALALSPSSPPPQDGQPSDAPGLSPSSSTLLLCPSDSTLSICHLNSQSVVKTGIFGNMATIFVMRRIKDHNSSQYAILMVLAVSDLTFLGSGVYGEFIGLYFTWVFLFMSSIIASVCLFVCDIILSITLFRAVSSSAVAAPADSNVTSLHNTDTRRKMSLRTTVMVLAISCAFLVLTLPVCVHLIWFNNTAAVLYQSPKAMAMAKLLESVTYQLSHTNSSVNFFLYILTGTKFRREFVSWFRCGALSLASSVQEATSEASRGGRHK